MMLLEPNDEDSSKCLITLHHSGRMIDGRLQIFSASFEQTIVRLALPTFSLRLFVVLGN